MADGVKLVGTLLQLAAPKCVICWTSIAGLWNAGWFVARTTNPWWVFFASAAAAVSLGAGFISAYRRRQFAGFALAVLAWLLLASSWMLGTDFTRYAGIAVLLTSIAIDRRPKRCALRR